ncbi:MAG: maleylacetoacetate isomerase [Legionella sp.]
MKLYDYFRSTACYRVRIALELKGIAYEKIEVHLVNNGGEQHRPEYRNINPQGLVPTLEVDGHMISQSLAIISYLDNEYPQTPLLPAEPIIRAQLQALALLVSCDMHPLNNLRVLNQLKTQFAANETQKNKWYHHWLKAGFDAFEKQLHLLPRSQPVCFGTSPTLADVCLIPQVYNAHRYEFALDDYPLIQSIYKHCLTLPAIQAAAPN